MFKKILIVYSKKNSETHTNSLNKVKMILKKENILFNSVSIKDFKVELLNGVDLVISVGGDGNFIRVSHSLEKIPLLGINSDFNTSEGFLCNLNNLNIDELSKILKGEYRVSFRERIDIILDGKRNQEIALNEVYIGTSNQFHTSRYVIKFKNIEEEHRSSGVLVSTGTGSSGWYKSIKGLPFDYQEKRLKFIVREPFFSRLFNPKLLEGEILDRDKISFESKRSFGGIIAIDSNLTYDFNEETKVELKISDYPLKVIEKI